MSDVVAWADARAVFRLLGELSELGNDTLAWRRHLLVELARLVDAPISFAAEAPEGQLLCPSSHVGAVETGWATESDRRVWWGACTRVEADLDPADPAIVKLGVAPFTRSSTELGGARAWYRSTMYGDHYRPAGLDHYLLSTAHIPESRSMHFILVPKGRRARPFSDREKRLVHLLHGELAIACAKAASVRLPRRLEQILTLLEGGRSEKQVAAELAISPQTVHHYCKALHVRFGVHSRSELLARVRKLPRGPRLLLQDRGGRAARR